MAAYTDTDATDAVMAGGGTDDGSDRRATSIPSLILNLRKKKQLPGQADPNSNVQAGASADGTNNGTSVSSSTKPSKPVIQADEQPPSVLGANPEPAQTSPDTSSDALIKEQTGQMEGEAKSNQPRLAPQGSSNKFIHMLQRASGQVGPQPEPGQPYVGPTTPQQKERNMGIFLKGIGRGMQSLGGAAGGTQQRQIYSELPIQERAQDVTEEGQRLAAQKLGEEMQYRRGLLAEGQERVDVSRQREQTGEEKAGTAASSAQVNARAKGQMIQADGSVRPMTGDEILRDPVLSSNQAVRASGVELKQAEAALAAARQDAIMNPNNPQFQQRERDIQGRLSLAREHVGIALQSLQMRGTEGMYNFGRNPLTGEDLSGANAPPGMLSSETGQPVPFRLATMFGPTGTLRTSAARAENISRMVPTVIKEIQTLGPDLGPIMGRWNDFMQGKVGADNPDFAGLRMDLALVASGVALAHAVGRLPENLRVEFEHMINAPQQDPKNIIASLQHVLPILDQMKNVGMPHTMSGGTPASASARPVNPVAAAAQSKNQPKTNYTPLP